MLRAAGIADRFGTVVDGVVARELGLEGKPRPDPFLEAARRLEVAAARAVVVEDAVAGVEAGSAGGFDDGLAQLRLGHRSHHVDPVREERRQ